MLATANAERSSRFELAAVRLLLCAQAAGAHHQTPMTRAPVASTRDRSKPHSSRALHGKVGNDVVSICYVVVFFAGLTGFLAAALTLATHPLEAVLLALGAMALLLHALAELLQVSQIPLERPRCDQAENDPKLY
jgi:hypothetical protein